MMENPLVIEQKDSVGDTLEVQLYGNRLTVSVDEPWAGDTESGFGQNCSISLTIEQARLLQSWLNEMVPHA